MVFQIEGKEWKDQERLTICRKKSILERGRCFSMIGNFSEPVAEKEERFVAAARNSTAEKAEPKEK